MKQENKTYIKEEALVDHNVCSELLDVSVSIQQRAAPLGHQVGDDETTETN